MLPQPHYLVSYPRDNLLPNLCLLFCMCILIAVYYSSVWIRWVKPPSICWWHLGCHTGINNNEINSAMFVSMHMYLGALFLGLSPTWLLLQNGSLLWPHHCTVSSVCEGSAVSSSSTHSIVAGSSCRKRRQSHSVETDGFVCMCLTISPVEQLAIYSCLLQVLKPTWDNREW